MSRRDGSGYRLVTTDMTEHVVRQCKQLGLTRIWMQPGAESEAAIEYCHANGLHVVYDACAMVEKRRWPAD